MNSCDEKGAEVGEERGEDVPKSLDRLICGDFSDEEEEECDKGVVVVEEDRGIEGDFDTGDGCGDS